VDTFSLAPLLSGRQHTVARPTTWVEGFTLRNHPARVRFLPAPADHGREFIVYAHGRKSFRFKLGLGSGDYGGAGTNAIDPVTGNGLAIVEHLGAAIVLAGLDNVIIEVEYPDARPTNQLYRGGKVSSMPLLDGTPLHYLKAIQAAGVVQQQESRRWLQLAYPCRFTVGHNSFELRPRSLAGWSLDVTITPSAAHWWQGQRRHVHWDPLAETTSASASRISDARPTNGSWQKWLLYRAMALGSGRKLDFMAVYTPWSRSPLDGQPPYRPDEAVFHRCVDLLGDLLFFGGWWQADMTVVWGRHHATNAFRQYLVKENPFT
jgi:UDP-3-O-acyl-N-acetylglucosamine deacetylase